MIFRMCAICCEFFFDIYIYIYIYIYIERERERERKRERERESRNCSLARDLIFRRSDGF